MSQRVRRTVEEARRALLDAAEEIVREVGPAGLRLKDVAKRAGTTHPNLLHHFGSREGLMQALTTRSLQHTADLVVEVTGNLVTASVEERVPALADLFQELQLRGNPRLLAWLLLSGRFDGVDRPDLEPLLQLAHSMRAPAVRGPEAIDDTRRVLTLMALAMVGDAVSGDTFHDGFGLPAGEEGRREFRAWLAEFLVDLSQLTEKLDQGPP